VQSYIQPRTRRNLIMAATRVWSLCQVEDRVEPIWLRCAKPAPQISNLLESREDRPDREVLRRKTALHTLMHLCPGEWGGDTGECAGSRTVGGGVSFPIKVLKVIDVDRCFSTCFDHPFHRGRVRTTTRKRKRA